LDKTPQKLDEVPEEDFVFFYPEYYPPILTEKQTGTNPGANMRLLQTQTGSALLDITQ